MSKRLFVCFFILFSCLDLLPQEGPQHNRKIFDTWVSLRNVPEGPGGLAYRVGRLPFLGVFLRVVPGVTRGVLYEVRDSSVLLSNSRIRNDYLTGNFSLTEFNYLDISRLQLRRKNAELKGALIGGGIAGLAAVQIVKEIFETSSSSRKEMAGYYFWFGTPITMLGIGVGTIIGSVPIQIPIHGDYDKFDSQRRRLINKALLVHDLDDILRRSPYMMEHGSYAGWLIGPSFPVGDFAGASHSGNDRSPKTGYSSDYNLGFTFRQGFKISLSGFFSSYNLSDEHQDTFWVVSGFSIGPVLKFSLTEKTCLDLIPRIGFVDALLGTEEILEKSMIGIAINPRIAFRYNFAARWVFMTKAEYMVAIPRKADLDASELNVKNLQTLNLGMGAGYRFR